MIQSRGQLVRLRRTVFAAIAVAIVLRLLSLFAMQVEPAGRFLAPLLGLAALLVLLSATYYALRHNKHFPRFGWLVLLAIVCVGASHAFDFFIGGFAPFKSATSDSLTGPETIRAALFLGGIGIALIGFYLSIFDLLEVRAIQLGEQERLTESLREQERAEKALRTSEEQLRKIFDGMVDAVFVHDFDGKIIEANDAASTRMGYTREEFMRMRTMDLDAPEFAAGFADRLRHQMDNKRHRCEGIHLTKDRRAIPVDIQTTLIEFRGAPAVLAVIRDISDQRRVEQERTALQSRVAQAEKLESLGVMAGGIAHDFNSLLMGVLGNASLALLDLPQGAPVRRNLEQIEASAQRAAHLSHQMLAYSGRATFSFNRFHLGPLVREAESAIVQSIAANVRVEYACDDTLPRIEGDRTQLMQVVLSLVTNAAESYGDHGGVVTVKTSFQQVTPETPRPPRLTDSLHDGKYVLLEVFDQGVGMDDQTMDRIFDPFFTTKFTGRGLGLAAVMGIVRGHRGLVSVRSALHRGSTFTVYFPVETTPAPVEPVVSPVDGPSCGHGILVVDDEETVLSVASRTLARSGYSVHIAHDGFEAIDILRARGYDIAVVLLDMTMPRMSGEDACRALRELRDDVRIIISSGYSEEDTIKRVNGVAIDGFLQKPYTPADLLGYIGRFAAQPSGIQGAGQPDYQV